MIESAMVSISAAADTTPKKVAESAPTASLVSSAAKWLAGARPTSGESVSNLDASEVLDSATKWLASEGVTNNNANVVFPAYTPAKARRPSSPMRQRYTYDAPQAPVSTPKWRPKERNETTTNVNRVGGSPVRSSRLLATEGHPFKSSPETAPLPQWSSVPSPERMRRSNTERSNEDNDSPPSKRKRGRESSSSSIMEGVEGLGQRLKRVCLKAKFHRRGRAHVSSEDLTMIGTTPIIPLKPEAAPITPPVNKKGETNPYSSRPVLGNKKASSRSLGTGISTTLDGDHDQVAFVSRELPVSNATSHSLVTGIFDKQNEKVKTQTPVVDSTKNETAAAKAQTFGLQEPIGNIFQQRRDSGKGVLDESESDQEIVFTESVTSSDDASFSA